MNFECPECNSRDTIKVISTPNIRFKGSGFYINDYQGDQEK